MRPSPPRWFNGYAGAAGWFFLHGMPVKDKLNPGYAQIVPRAQPGAAQCGGEGDRGRAETGRDLSSKLLRLRINSAGFGLSCEIQSFKHAVTILELREAQQVAVPAAGHGEQKDPAAPA